MLPDPAVGTRLAFRLVYVDTRSSASASTNHNNMNSYLPPAPRFISQDLGSVVLGAGGPGAESTTEAEDAVEGARTLGELRYVTGDYISCAVLPPSDQTGEVVPAIAAHTGRGTTSLGQEVPSSPPSRPRWDKRTAGSGGRREVGWASERQYGRGAGGSGAGLPQGEWRRGQRLPGQSSRGPSVR